MRRRGRAGCAPAAAWCALALVAGCSSTDAPASARDGGLSAADGAATDGSSDDRTDVPDSAPTGCPRGLPGAELVEVREAGEAFCIDAREVTQIDYAAFLEVARGTRETDECDWNVIDAPCPSGEEWQGGCGEPDGPCPNHFDPVGTPERRMGCVDWCDAKAYCEWAGKRLCGGLGGRVVTLEENWGPDSPVLTEWRFACTQGGRTKYPYGDAHEIGRCDDYSAPGPSYGSAECRGTLPRYDAIADLPGSVREWTALCEDSRCSTEGGSSAGPAASCEMSGASSMRSLSKHLGFRCCTDAGAAP